MTTSQELSLDHDEVTSLLFYDPKTGIFIWRVNVAKNIKAGSRAGCFIKGLGYRQLCINYAHVREHRLAFFYMTGEWPSEVDHINGKGDDNRWNNLRLATRQQNSRNSKKRSDNTTGYRGVSLFRRTGKFVAEIWVSGRKKSLGYFPTAEAASAVYQEVSRKLAGEFHPGDR